MNPLKIAIVDDHPLFRMGLKHILKANPLIDSIDLVENYRELNEICSLKQIDMILMDIQLDKEDGVILTARIKNLFPNIKILALSAHDDSFRVHQMLEAGASGYVLKGADVDELLLAIQVIRRGSSYFSLAVSDVLVGKKQLEPTKVHNEKLTIRELEILKFIIQEELSNKEIADRLFISTRTVETHKRNLIQKLRVKNTVGLAKYYFEYSDTLSKIYGIPLG